MTQISSSATFFYKRVFPAFWFGIVIIAAISGIGSGAYQKNIMVLVVPVMMLTIGFVVMKKFVWDLADKVMDGGSFLLVTQRGEEVRVPLSNIMNVSLSATTNPKRITLRLVTAGKLGNEIAFTPPTVFSLNPFAKNMIAENLMVRVDQARATRSQ